MLRERAALSLTRRDATTFGTSGSMLAMGVPIALVLTALVWYLIGVSNAALEAQGVRAAADKTAYEAAVWHARGMNVVATLNLLMESLASVLVAWAAFHDTIKLAATICYTDTSCSTTTAIDLIARINAADPAVDAWLKAQIKTVGVLEQLTVTVAPTVAFNQSTAGTSGLVSFTVPYATAMVPDSRIASVLGPAASTPRWGMSANLPALPVEPQHEADFCASAGPPVADVAKDLLDGIHAPWVIPLLVKHGIDYKHDWDAIGTMSGCLGVGGEAAGIWQAATVSNPNYRFAFQVYGFAFGRDGARPGDEENVTQLVGNGTAAPTAGTGWTASAAEFFYPCTSGWATCAGPSLFEPSWQARLMRVRPPPGGADVIGSIAGNLTFSAPGFASTVLGSTAVWTRVKDLVH